MNYRHIYHAGNHADILKHILLSRVLVHLGRKEKAFRAYDAHAGLGVYPLDGLEAQKTGEYQGGIAKLEVPFTPEVEALLKPYREVIADLNPSGPVVTYPGSSWFMAQLSRAQDRLVFNELHPQDYLQLENQFRGDPRVTAKMIDAMQLLKSDLPPPERRGVVLLDPPYEVKNEKEKVMQALAFGHRRFATGVFIIWYPVKGLMFADDFCQSLKSLDLGPMLRVEVRVREAFEGGGLAGSGLLVLNPTWGLADEMALIAPAIAQRLGLGQWGNGRVEWLISEPPV